MPAISTQDLLNYINQARTNPKKFSTYVQNELNQFIGQDKLPLKPNCHYATNQGKKAWLQAIKFLKSVEPLQPYKQNHALSLAAMDHAHDLKTSNIFGHQSSDGTSFDARIFKRASKSLGSAGQNLGSQFDIAGRDHALQTVLGLIIDDGVPNRGHRKNIFSRDFKYIGLYAIKVGDKIYTVMDFHSQNLKTMNYTMNPLTPGGNISKQNNQQPIQKNFGVSDLENKFNNLKMGTNGLKNKYVVSKSTSTSTSTVNGVTKKVVTTTLKYSDGSTEQIVEKKTSS